MYTGAPIFAAQAALKSGADLIYFLCPESAAAGLRSLFEAVVIPVPPEGFSLAEAFKEALPGSTACHPLARALQALVFPRVTACVVGSGMGRPSSAFLSLVVEVLNYLISEFHCPIIFDGDAIHYYKNGKFRLDILEGVICLLTPNKNEAEGLVACHGAYVLAKGAVDTLSGPWFESSSDSLKVIKLGSDQEMGSRKRCGGLGDILAGVLAEALSVARHLGGGRDSQVCWAATQAVKVVRAASAAAFKSEKYSLTASDVVKCLNGAIYRK